MNHLRFWVETTEVQYEMKLRYLCCFKLEIERDKVEI